MSHPFILEQIAADRQREVMAAAQRQRLARHTRVADSTRAVASLSASDCSPPPEL